MVKTWAMQQIKKNNQSVNDQIDTMQFQLQKQLDDILDNHLQAPGLFGKDQQHKTISSFMLDNHPKMKTHLE